jgi:hypothetical protein
VSEELVFAVDGEKAMPAMPVSFAAAGLREREHLQEWVIANPDILGPGVMIVTFEFDRWVTAAGQPTYERLDVLGLDQAGYLVVAELKRDVAPDSVTMQALNYAAMVSRFNLDVLAEVYAASSASPSELTPQEALTTLQDWAPGLSDESVGSPRIILLATAFSPPVTNLAMFLYENGIDIRLSRVQPYETPDGGHIVTVSPILPIPNAEDFMVKPRSGQQRRAATTASLSEWNWDEYRAQLHFSEDRLVLAQRLVEGLAAGIEKRSLPWRLQFRKGYVAFQRAGGYNVIAVDLMWVKPVRLWVKLPAAPEELPNLENPLPQFTPIWTGHFREWGWHVPSLDEVPDLDPLLDFAEVLTSSA